MNVADRITDRLRHMALLKRGVLAGRNIRTRLIEKWLRVSTVHPADEQFSMDTHFADGVAYEPVDYVLLHKFMKPLTLQRDDVIFDIGCGMGRALCLFARRNVRACVGIEFNDRLADIAKANTARLRGRHTQVEVRCGDAIEADYSTGTVFWLFNPFGAKTMQSVLERIEQSVRTRARAIQLAYINPMHEHLLDQQKWLTCVHRYRSLYFKTYGASYWRNAI